MSKNLSLAVVCVLAVAVVGWWLLTEPSPVAPPPAVDVSTERAVVATASVPDSRAAEPMRTVVVPTPGPGEASAPDIAPTELRGRVVVAGSGEPIAGAQVTLQRRDADEFWNLDLAYGDLIATSATTTSDTNGRFRFDVLRARQHRLVVRASGFATTTLVNRSGGSEVVVEMGRGSTLEGTVRCDNQGVAGAEIRITIVGQSVDLATGPTDVLGAFQFTDLQPVSVSVQTHSPNHASSWRRVDLRAGEVHHLDVVLDAGAAVRGEVVDAASKLPIADAEISDSWVFRKSAHTGSDGRFELRGVKNGGFTEIHVRARGYASATRNVSGKVGEEQRFDLERGSEVIGRVMNAASEPVANAYVALCASFSTGPGMNAADWISARVASDGRFRASGLRSDQHYWLFARADGFGSRVHALARRVENERTLDVGNVVLLAEGGVEGVVRDDGGSAMPGVRVSLRGTNSDAGAWLVANEPSPPRVIQFEHRSATTDGNGVFRFAGVAAGAYTLAARPVDHDREVLAEVVVRDAEVTRGIEMVVATSAAIRGTLRYADGRPFGDEAGEVVLVAAHENGGSTNTRIGTDGTFRFAGLQEGRYTVTAFSCPPGWALSARHGVVVPTSDLELTLQPASFISGRVVDGNGDGCAAMAWARVEGYLGGTPMQPTAPDGTFRITVAADFRGEVGAMKTDNHSLQSQTADVTAGRADLVIQLLSEEERNRRR